MKLSQYYVPISRTLGYDAMDQPFTLIFGPTRSGKSFLTLHLINVLASLPLDNINGLHGLASCPTQMYIIDLKNAEMAGLGRLLPPDRVATSKSEALKLLVHFIELKRKRANFIADKTSFGATASMLHMPLFCLILEEYATTNAVFNEGLSKQDRNDRYKWDALIRELFLTGAGLGFVAIIITQQPSVGNAGLSTIITEQVSVKLGMGAMTSTQLRLGFGNDVDIPDYHLTKGEGLAWINGSNDELLMPFRAPHIDPSRIWETLKLSLSYQDTDRYLLMTNT